jgi:hypothetical protein
MFLYLAFTEGVERIVWIPLKPILNKITVGLIVSRTKGSRLKRKVEPVQCPQCRVACIQAYICI